MKPIVVSAAAAVRAPSAVPSVSAALPCNRRRREMLLKSIDDSPWRVIPAPIPEAPPDRRGTNLHVASFVPELGRVYLFVCISEKLLLGQRGIFRVTKMTADFADCMRES
jgi:hypothetical protein